MKKLVLTALISLVAVTSFARKDVTTIVVSQDTIFYNQQLKSVVNSEAAAYYRLFAKEISNGLQRDVFQDYYMNGQLRTQGGYAFLDLGNDRNTVLDGEVTTYYPDGKEKTHCTYKNGKRNGYFTMMLRNGSIGVVEYKHGEPVRDFVQITHTDGTMERVSIDAYKGMLM